MASNIFYSVVREMRIGRPVHLVMLSMKSCAQFRPAHRHRLLHVADGNKAFKRM